MYKKICITNRHLTDDLMKSIRYALQSGCEMIILREKDLDAGAYAKLAAEIIELCREHDALCMLHTFTEVCRSLNHPYIHLTYGDFLEMTPEKRARYKKIGVSTHSIDEAKMCDKLGASYVMISPIFVTACKPGAEPRGLAFIEAVTGAVSLDVYALGGIHPDNAKSCIDAGADGVCMMSEFMSYSDDENTVKLDNFGRYHRQMLLDGFGEEGQKNLRNAKVLVVGAGGLGSPVSQYLAGAGVGTLGLIDFDSVDISNLHRQVIHDETNVGLNKAESAKAAIARLNSEVTVKTYEMMLTEDNAEEIIEQYDFVIDAVDNFQGKFLINDTCVKLGVPFCHGGVLGMTGQAMTWVKGKGPCFRCIFEDVPADDEVQTTSQVGVAGPIVGIIGCIQAMEAIKYFIGAGEMLTGKMYMTDLGTMKTRVANFPSKRSDCPSCGDL